MIHPPLFLSKRASCSYPSPKSRCSEKTGPRRYGAGKKPAVIASSTSERKSWCNMAHVGNSDYCPQHPLVYFTIEYLSQQAYFVCSPKMQSVVWIMSAHPLPCWYASALMSGRTRSRRARASLGNVRLTEEAGSARSVRSHEEELLALLAALRLCLPQGSRCRIVSGDIHGIPDSVLPPHIVPRAEDIWLGGDAAPH